jgi:antitoxin FitA
MPTLQVRDFPQELYNKLDYLSKKEHRSLAQETIVLLSEIVDKRLDKKNGRKKAIESFTGLGIDTASLPAPEKLIREDRDNR